MAGLKQSKRVSWAPDVKLCQVRLFLSEDSPSQSGSGFQDHLQAKASWLQHSREPSVDESLPPGFESPLIPYQSNKWISEIPLVKWKAPLKFFLNQEWLVVAGEESEEVGVENQRQIGVFEAIYPRLSSIPPNPILSDVQDSHYEDAQTTLIPMTAIEDDDPSDEYDSQVALHTSSAAQHAEVTKSLTDVRTPSMSVLTADRSAGNTDPCAPNMHDSEKPLVGLIHGVEPDVMAAASAAFTALIRSSEEGSLIDRDLLIKILSNPSLVEKLMSEYGVPKQHAPPVQPVPPAPIAPVSVSAPLPAPQLARFRPTHSAVLRPPTSLPPTSPGIQIAANPAPVSGAPAKKDMSYFKTLIQQHGGDKQEVVDPSHAPLFDGHRRFPSGEAVGGSNADQGVHGPVVHNRGDAKSNKIQKPCIYFNSPRGCRRGADCLYVHDGSLPQTIERQGRKKIKLDREPHQKSRQTF